jgi:hypothetical protein
MSRRTIRLAAAGGVVATVALCGGTAFAADAEYPVPPPAGNPGGTPGGGNGGNTPGGSLGNSPGISFTSTTSNGGSVSGGGSGTSGSGSSLPFTGFELATALTLGVGAIGAGSIVVVASRRRRDTSALA